VIWESYRAASSQAGLFDEMVVLLAEVMSQRGLERARGGDISKSAISRMREAEGKASGEEAYEDMREFEAERNAAAGLILVMCLEKALTLHRLRVPST